MMMICCRMAVKRMGMLGVMCKGGEGAMKMEIVMLIGNSR
jgi:hypothetical protein